MNFYYKVGSSLSNTYPDNKTNDSENFPNIYFHNSLKDCHNRRSTSSFVNTFNPSNNDNNSENEDHNQHFKIQWEYVGSGGFCHVFRDLINSDVAYKIYKHNINLNGLGVFNPIECYIHYNLFHKNLCTLRDIHKLESIHQPVKEIPSRNFTRIISSVPYAMKYAPYGSLKSEGFLSSVNLNLENIKSIFSQVCKGVKFLHDHSIIHCDIKPSNVLVFSLEPLHVGLGDYGLSLMLFDRNYVNYGDYFGTEEYLWPGSLSYIYCYQTDYWALGCLLYWLLKGKNLFENSIISKTCYFKRDHQKFENTIEELKRSSDNKDIRIIDELNNCYFKLMNGDKNSNKVLDEILDILGDNEHLKTDFTSQYNTIDRDKSNNKVGERVFEIISILKNEFSLIVNDPLKVLLEESLKISKNNSEIFILAIMIMKISQPNYTNMLAKIFMKGRKSFKIDKFWNDNDDSIDREVQLVVNGKMFEVIDGALKRLGTSKNYSPLITEN